MYITGNLHIYMYCFVPRLRSNISCYSWQPIYLHVLFLPFIAPLFVSIFWQPTYLHVLFLYPRSRRTDLSGLATYISTCIVSGLYARSPSRLLWQPTYLHVLFLYGIRDTIREVFWQPTYLHVLFRQKCTNIGLLIL